MRIVIDLTMLAGYVLVMVYVWTGNFWHEIIGVSLGALVLLLIWGVHILMLAPFVFVAYNLDRKPWKHNEQKNIDTLRQPQNEWQL